MLRPSYRRARCEQLAASHTRAKGVGSSQLGSRPSQLRGRGQGKEQSQPPRPTKYPLKNLHPAPRGTGVIPIIQYTHMWRKMIPCSCRAVSQKTGSAGRAPPDQQREGRPSQKTSNSSFKVASRNSAISIFINHYVR